MSVRRSALAPLAAAAVVLAASPAASAAPAVPARVPPWPTQMSQNFPASMLQPATETTAQFLATMRVRLAKRVQAKALRGSLVSVFVADLATGQPQFGYNGARGRVPASTEKTATALAVLSTRGADRRLRTRVLRSANGLQLTLVGGGDPLLSSYDLDLLADRTARHVLAAGPQQRRIRLNYDDSLFAPATLPPGWYSSYYWDYATRPTALTRDLRRVGDPSRDAAIYFRARLKKHGLRMVRGATHQAAPAGSRRIARFRGHTIAESVWPMLQYSDNSIAEILARQTAVGRHMPTTSAGAAAAVRSELGRLMVPVRRVRIHDGSGLSRADRESALSLVSITRAAMNPFNPNLAIGFRTSAYPMAGVSGTLASRYHERRTACAAGRIMAKTGTLSDTIALSGVAGSSDGRLRAFAIIVNDKPDSVSTSTARYRVDRIATAVTGCD